ncbi:integumentary mucin C.1-like [Anopheles arabiensis]|uniref:Uncharacterized protein n=1 Tax=Anopheles arabiensis TaxID=7173 RepID=A0A2C9GPP4_ANOAR|nr:integumentary mucin C.1-like [Anopheles arabiensis]XP_040173929.1 integumentary mucin C.1-like [Anopheles arabiensis]
MRTALVYYVCFGVILLARGSGSGAPPQHPDAPNVNATVAKVIGAMLADGGERDNGTVSAQQEHHADRGQRIVARKGVSNDMVVPVRSAVPEHPSTVGASGNGTAHRQANATTGTTLHESTSSSGAHGSTLPAITSANASSTAPSSATSASAVQPPPQSRPPTSANATTTQRTVAASSSSSSSTTTTTTTTTTSTTTTTTTSTTTTTTTTKPPKKPKITYSIEDEPNLLQAAKPGYGAAPYDPQVDSSGRLRVDEPLAQFSKEYLPPGGDLPNGRREYIVPIVTLIFAIPLLLGLFLLSYRRAKEFWLTRHYRRMDFLIDGMYNY